MKPDVTNVMLTDGLNAAKTAHILSQELMRMETPDTTSKKRTYAIPATRAVHRRGHGKGKLS
jgi:hypothetical protein